MFFSRATIHPFWRNLGDVQQEFHRLFDRFGNHPFGLGEFPAVDLRDEQDSLHLEAELPGLELSDLEVFVTGQNQLTIRGERKAPVVEKGVQHRNERAFGKFTRVLTLPYAVNENAVEAKFENGVLSIRLPKHEAAKPRKIAIKA